MYFSYATLVGVLLRAQQRKQNDVADGARVGEQHGEPVDADSLATRGRHPVAQGANVVLIDGVGGEISLFAQELLVLEPVALLGRVVQLAEGDSVPTWLQITSEEPNPERSPERARRAGRRRPTAPPTGCRSRPT